VVEGACRREEIYSGSQVEKAPDISIRWKTDFVISGLATGDDNQSSVDSEALPAPLNNGGHRMDGILIMNGEGVRNGVELSGAEIVDIAPTILFLSGSDIPADLDGKVLTEALRQSYLDSHLVKTAPTATEVVQESSGTEYSDADAKVIEDRLKGMGYLG